MASNTTPSAQVWLDERRTGCSGRPVHCDHQQLFSGHGPRTRVRYVGSVGPGCGLPAGDQTHYMTFLTWNTRTAVPLRRSCHSFQVRERSAVWLSKFLSHLTRGNPPAVPGANLELVQCKQRTRVSVFLYSRYVPPFQQPQDTRLLFFHLSRFSRPPWWT